MSRPRPTAVDYIVVALSPALIMSLVGSLAFFLVRVFYQGQHSVRLQIILGLFVFAAVLISRISIESGKGRAALFALPLAVATGLAMLRFAEVRGQMAGLSGLINFAVLGIVWWCTHKLTLDCTVLDESHVQSEQGLLQFIGLDGKKETTTQEAPPDTSNVTTKDEASGWKLQTWWKRLANPPRKPKTHGVWVVYFSLAALPLFGIGQLFIPSGDASGRSYTFVLLCIYLVSGFGLLITTSLVSLRRYLRQRDLQMPGTMVKTWLLAGGALVLVVLCTVWLLPRGIADFGITRPPFFGSRDDLATSEIAPGTDGPRHDPDASKVNERLEDSNASKPIDGDDGEGGQRKKDGDGKNGKGDSEQDAKNSKNDQSNGKGSPEKPEKRDDASADRHSDSNDEPDKGQGDSSGSNNEEAPADSTAASDQAAKPNAAKRIMESVVEGVWNLLKYVFYAVLAGIGVFFAWKYRKTIQAAWREFVAELRELWRRLFGPRGKSESKTHESLSTSAVAVPKPFSAFQDPFVSGAATKLSAEQLVRHTFSALEAWASERTTPRDPQQTPTEFAELVANRFQDIRGEVRDLCNLYCHAAYASDDIIKEDVMRLEVLWRKLNSSAPALQASIS